MNLDQIQHYSTNPDEPVLFYGGPFSNFVESPIWYPGARTYPTVEHWFQAHKATTATEHEEVRLASSPGQAKSRGQRVNLRPGWNETRYGVMVEGLRLKYEIPSFWAELLATADRQIVEDSPTDFIWGMRSANGKWEGQNLLGRALMQVRREIQAARARPGRAGWPGWVDSSTGEPL